MKLCTTIIPTIGRPTLERAIMSALEQDIDSDLHDVVVVNDSDKNLDYLQVKYPRIILVNSNQSGPCVARNLGVTKANSRFLKFLDDDDYMVADGLNALLEVARSSKAVWIYGGMHCVDNEGALLFDNQPQVKGNLFSHFVVGETLSLVASIVDREAFLRVNGFDLEVIPSEDRHLACRLALIGDFEGTDRFVATARIGINGSSFDYSGMTKASRQVREMGLNLPCALERLLDSVRDDMNLRGRVCRAYLFSSILNFADGKVVLALRRFFSCITLASHHIFRPRFWRGVFHSFWMMMITWYWVGSIPYLKWPDPQKLHGSMVACIVWIMKALYFLTINLKSKEIYFHISWLEKSFHLVHPLLIGKLFFR